MSAELRAARELLKATEALQGAVHAEPEALGLALEARTAAFRAFEGCVSEAPGPEVRALVARVRAIDQRVVAQARDLQTEVRGQLDALARARQAVRALRVTRPDDAPRFIAQRV